MLPTKNPYFRLGVAEAAVKIAALADSYGSMAVAHAQAALQLVQLEERVEAADCIGQSKAFEQICRRLIALATELREI